MGLIVDAVFEWRSSLRLGAGVDETGTPLLEAPESFGNEGNCSEDAVEAEGDLSASKIWFVG